MCTYVCTQSLLSFWNRYRFLCLCLCERNVKGRRDTERQWERVRLLACCIYGHFLSSLNRAGCAGNLRSRLQMVCIMFNPPLSPSPPLLLSLFLFPSLPFSINHENLKLYVFEKNDTPLLRKSYKIVLGSLSTSNTPSSPLTSLQPPGPQPAFCHPVITLVIVLLYLAG